MKEIFITGFDFGFYQINDYLFIFQMHFFKGCFQDLQNDELFPKSTGVCSLYIVLLPKFSQTQ